ncbi:MAG: hypothetical protein Tsb0019_25730 [Roseibium sp.]
MLRKTVFAFAALALSTGFASAMTVQAVTEGTRAKVFDTIKTSPTDAASTSNGFTLNGGSSLLAGQSIDIYGRIVGAIDRFNFTSSSSVMIEWIFGGYFLDDNGSKGAFVSDSGFVLEGSSGGNTIDMAVYTPDASGTKIPAVSNPFSTNITGGSPTIFALLGPGSYTFEIDNSSPSKAALYDIRISAVPIPAALPLLAGGIAILGFAGWRRRAAA